MIKNRLATFILMILVVMSFVGAVYSDEKKTEEIKKVSDVFPTLTIGALAGAKVVDLADGVVLDAGDYKLKAEDVDKELERIADTYKAQFKNNKFFLLENMTAQNLVTKEANKWADENNVDKDNPEVDVLQKYFDSIASKVTVSDEEAKAFYDANKDMIGDQTYDDIKNDIIEYLKADKQQSEINNWVNKLSDRIEIKVDKKWTQEQYDLALDNELDKARKNAKLPTMAFFFSTTCKPCADTKPHVQSIKTEFADKLNVVSISTNDNFVLSERYGIEVVPIIVFFDKDGKEVSRNTGYISKEDLTAKLKDVGVTKAE
ncbi:MAG: thioredoxin family protein [Armatimonadota bacterium]